MDSKVTVLIPFYNPGIYILDALNSVFAQTYKDWRLILVNDASTDDTLSMIGEYLKDPRVRLVEHSENQGQSMALNTGLSVVDTPFMIQLDADDWFEPRTLEIFLEETAMMPDTIAVFSGNINLVFEEPHQLSRKPVILKKQLKRRSLRRRTGRIIKGQSYQNRYDFLLANRSVWPRFYRTSALKRVGGWPVDDPYHGRYAEDIRVLFRLIEHYSFHWLDEVLLNHRRHDKNQTNQLQTYRAIVEWTVRDALKRWGDQYDPRFETSEDGWLKVSELILK